MNGRIYDPLLGRFLSADVVVQAPGNLQAYNRYSYVMNNPLSKTDPSGFMETTITEEDAKKKKDSAPKINEVVNKAINKVFSDLEKGKIKPEQAAGQLHSILNKGSDMYGNNTALSREVQKQGKDYVVPGKTEGTKYQGGLPVQEGASKEAEAKAGAVGKIVLEQGLARKNEDGKLVLKDSVSIAPGVNVDGKAVGTDKLDHVVDNGFNLFKAGFTRKEALTQSARDESGISGMTSTGVFSRGDIAANMVGFDLYSAVDTAARSGSSAPQFDITPSASKLDENINPNSYTTDVQALVDKNTQK